MLYWRYHQYQVTGDQYAECGDGDLGHNPSAPPPPDPLAPTTPLVHLPIPPPRNPSPCRSWTTPPSSIGWTQSWRRRWACGACTLCRSSCRRCSPGSSRGGSSRWVGPSSGCGHGCECSGADTPALMPLQRCFVLVFPILFRFIHLSATRLLFRCSKTWSAPPGSSATPPCAASLASPPAPSGWSGTSCRQRCAGCCSRQSLSCWSMRSGERTLGVGGEQQAALRLLLLRCTHHHPLRADREI